MSNETIKVLIVDDDPGDCRLVKLTLRKTAGSVKFSIKTAGSLAEGLECLANDSFDLMLLDLGLPDSCGLETVDKAYAVCPHIPIVVLTGLTNEEAGVEAIKRGASDYLVKSMFFGDLLVRTIRHAIERKKTEKMLEEVNEELKATVDKLTESNRELQEFAHIVAHDLKEPLRTIGVLVDWISTGYNDKLDKPGQDHVKLLVSRAERMSRLIDSILKYSEIRHARDKMEKVDLNLLLNEMISQIGPLENVEITVENEFPTVKCERIRVRQLFQSLVDNAVKFMDKPRGEVKISCIKKEGCWQFSVSDNGPGIEEKYFNKIFKIFQMLTPRDEIESTGIGLTVAKKIVELYSGKIWVESEKGCGSTFFFTLPKIGSRLTKDARLEANIIG